MMTRVLITLRLPLSVAARASAAVFEEQGNRWENAQERAVELRKAYHLILDRLDTIYRSRHPCEALPLKSNEKCVKLSGALSLFVLEPRWTAAGLCCTSERAEQSRWRTEERVCGFDLKHDKQISQFDSPQPQISSDDSQTRRSALPSGIE